VLKLVESRCSARRRWVVTPGSRRFSMPVLLWSGLASGAACKNSESWPIRWTCWFRLPEPGGAFRPPAAGALGPRSLDLGTCLRVWLPRPQPPIRGTPLQLRAAPPRPAQRTFVLAPLAADRARGCAPGGKPQRRAFACRQLLAGLQGDTNRSSCLRRTGCRVEHRSGVKPRRLRQAVMLDIPLSTCSRLPLPPPRAVQPPGNHGRPCRPQDSVSTQPGGAAMGVEGTYGSSAHPGASLGGARARRRPGGDSCASLRFAVEAGISKFPAGTLEAGRRPSGFRCSASLAKKPASAPPAWDSLGFDAACPATPTTADPPVLPAELSGPERAARRRRGRGPGGGCDLARALDAALASAI